MKTIITSACLVILSAFTGYGVEFDLGAHGSVSFTLPDGWNAKVEPVKRPDSYALSFNPTGDAQAKCLLTFLYVTGSAPDRELIRAAVLRINEPFVSQSVEKKATLKDFSLERGFGAYCVFTDASLVGKKPKPEDYKVMGSGQVQPDDDLVGVLSLFADDATGKEFEAMINIVNSMKIKLKAN